MELTWGLFISLIILALIVGVFLTYFWQSYKNKLQGKAFFAEKSAYLTEFSNQINQIQTKWGIAENEASRNEKQLQELTLLYQELQRQNTDLISRLAAQAVESKNLEEKLQNNKEEQFKAQQEMKLQFENMAHAILKEHSQEFTELNRKNMGDMLNPLKEKIVQFEKKVEETHLDGMKENVSLKTEVRKLYELNSKISEEANNLTRALKGENKTQGNWGEMVLERVLERSGLQKDQEYKVQVTLKNQNDDQIRPDVIVYLPDNKHVVIDSKVSLTAYSAYVNSEEEGQKKTYLDQHVRSIRAHIDGLSAKGYESAESIMTADFVLLFMPIEPAFSLAVQQDISLFTYAWDKKIVLVSPTTLLATLRTVASIWKSEKQTRNAMEIAAQGGKLYDKFCGFIMDFEKIGEQIQRLHKSYEDGHKKMVSGSGNLINSTQKMKTLGSKTSKTIPEKYLTAGDWDDLEQDETQETPQI